MRDIVDAASETLGRDGVPETHVAYQITRYTNDDADVSCTVALGTAQVGSRSHYLPSAVAGAAKGGCAAPADLPPIGPSAGNWAFESTSGGPHVTYRDDDAGHPFNGNVYRFAESECNTMLLSNDGVWTKVTLASAFD